MTTQKLAADDETARKDARLEDLNERINKAVARFGKLRQEYRLGARPIARDSDRS
ncbi:MAG: hypothetical protein AAFV19_04965 [Pseudomonadota bacterium]